MEDRMRRRTMRGAMRRGTRRSHLIFPPIAPRDDNRVVIVPCGDG
jgi:hypothetical protein